MAPSIHQCSAQIQHRASISPIYLPESRHLLSPPHAAAAAAGDSMATAGVSAHFLGLHLLAAVLALTRPTWAGYCDGDWLSVGRSTRFTPGPCLSVSGIGATQNPQKTIYIIDRTDYANTYLRFPGHGGARGGLAYAEEVSLDTGSQRPLNVVTDTFCDSGAYLPDGTFVAVGGDTKQNQTQPDGSLGNGAFSIRSLLPGKDFRLEQNMVSKRWYPTTQPMPDGRVVIVGGSLVGLDLNYGQQNNPTLEYYPRRSGEGQHDVPLLAQTLPYNLYPFVHLLPSGNLFIFSGNNFVLWDTGRNVQAGNPVALNVQDNQGDTVFFCYPLTATSVLFPLSAASNWVAEIMICGGASSKAKNRRGHMGNPASPAHQFCWRIQPEAKRPKWYEAVMSAPRVMPQAVLLPDASVLIMNGARTGYAGIPDFTTGPVLTPDHFDTRRKRWKGIPLAASKIPRLYHGSAFLLHDATVFVSGSNPNDGIRQQGLPGDTTFQSEIFSPPYLSGGAFPRITQSPANLNVGGAPFSITVQGPANANATAFSVVLSYPGYSTHSANHGMRNVELEIVSVSGQGPYQVNLKSPPSKNVAPPTWYWLFVLINGIPNRDGITMYINQ